MKIIGYTVGTTLPKPSFAQTDPSKGDYIKDKEVLMAEINTSISDSTAEAKSYADTGHDTTLQNANIYTDNAVAQKTKVIMKTWTAKNTGGI